MKPEEVKPEEVKPEVKPVLCLSCYDAIDAKEPIPRFCSPILRCPEATRAHNCWKESIAELSKGAEPKLSRYGDGRGRGANYNRNDGFHLTSFLAPFSSSSLTTASCPFSAAHNSGV